MRDAHPGVGRRRSASNGSAPATAAATAACCRSTIATREHDRDFRPDRLRQLLPDPVRLRRPDRHRQLLHHRFPSLDTRVSALDAKIDDLYQLPLGEFTGARNALAKSLSKRRGEARQSAGEADRRAVGGEPGLLARAQHLRPADEERREAARPRRSPRSKGAPPTCARPARRIAARSRDAVAEAERLSAASGAKPGADALARTFESLSLATSAPEAPGRLTDALQPAGFEALAGLADIRS